MDIERNRESSKDNELDRDYVKLLYEGKEVAFIYLDKQVEVIDNIECLLGGTRTGKAYTVDRIDNSVASVTYDYLDRSQTFLITKIMVHELCFAYIMSSSRVLSVDFRRLCSNFFGFDIEFCVDKKVYNLREIDNLNNMLGGFQVKTNDHKIFTHDTGVYEFSITYYKKQ